MMSPPRQRIPGLRSIRNRVQHGGDVITRRRQRSAAAAIRRWPVVICVAIPTSFLIGLSARPVARHESPPEPDRHVVEQASMGSASINGGANQFFIAVKEWIRHDCEDCEVPRFAKEKIEW